MQESSESIYRDPRASLEARVEDLFSRLTAEERLKLLSGTGFTTQPIPRLGLPVLNMVDGGQGVRGGMSETCGPATLFSGPINMASGWDRDIAARVGCALGVETANKGTGAQVLLGPCVNIHRTPLGGRNGESFSEDPYLSAEMTVAYINGLQSTGVAACVKHFAVNNEEVDRNTIDVIVDERAMREIYFPSFKAAVQQAKSQTIMASYNRLNGPYATASHYLMTEVLKDDWGFDGIAVSDWGAVHELDGVVNAGCDLEMPGGEWLTVPALTAGIERGALNTELMDDAVRRILRVIIRLGLLENVPTPDPSKFGTPEHFALALEAARGSIILLKNENGILPLDKTACRHILVVGPGATRFQAGAEGSVSVNPLRFVQPLDAIKAALGDNVEVEYVEGAPLPAEPNTVPCENLSDITAEYFTSSDLTGEPAIVREESLIHFRQSNKSLEEPGAVELRSCRWRGKLTAPQTGVYRLGVFTSSASLLVLDDEVVMRHTTSVDDHVMHSGYKSLEAGRTYDFRVEVTDTKRDYQARLGWSLPPTHDIPAAVAAAGKADLVLAFATCLTDEREELDRASLNFPGYQNELIAAVAAANPRTVVVMNNGSPVLMPWLDKVHGLIEAGLPGQEGPQAVVEVLFGDINPSGKLTDTLGARREDYPDTPNFPGNLDTGKLHYAEGVFVGYRHFDRAGIEPLFSFGHGLSYTTFGYANLRLSAPSMTPDGSLTATVDITNTGSREGAEIVQLYVRDTAPKIERPVRELKGFERITLKPGQTRAVTFKVTPQDLSYFDMTGRQWKAGAGVYALDIAASSRDIRLSATFELAGEYINTSR
ncbi:MAG: glycoside hydrolase family 3 C-terminal domain-containing protein [Capsulimonadaceae bacterium]